MDRSESFIFNPSATLEVTFRRSNDKRKVRTGRCRGGGGAAFLCDGDVGFWIGSGSGR